MIVLFCCHYVSVPFYLSPDLSMSLPGACSTANLHFPQVTTRGHSRSIFCKQSSMFDILVAEAWLASEHNSQNVQHCVTGVVLKEKMVCHTSPMQLQQHVAQLPSNTNTCTVTASAPQCRGADGQFPTSQNCFGAISMVICLCRYIYIYMTAYI